HDGWIPHRVLRRAVVWRTGRMVEPLRVLSPIKRKRNLVCIGFVRSTDINAKPLLDNYGNASGRCSLAVREAAWSQNTSLQTPELEKLIRSSEICDLASFFSP